MNGVQHSDPNTRYSPNEQNVHKVDRFKSEYLLRMSGVEYWNLVRLRAMRMELFVPLLNFMQLI